MTWLIRTGAAASVCALLACHSPAAPSANPARIAGRVLDYHSSQGVAGAVIEFGRRRLIADADGVYTGLVEPGTYFVRVDAEPLGTAIVRGGAFRGDLLVNANGCIAFYGVVLDARSGKGIEGATVRPGGTVVPAGSAPEQTTTGADGWYRIDSGCRPSLGTGTTLFTVTHPRYETYSRTGPRAEWIRGLQRLDLELVPRN